MIGGFSRYIGPGPETQEGARESLKGPKALAIDVLFRCFPFFGVVFPTICTLFRKIILVVYHHSHLHCNQESHHFITISFIGPQVLNS